MMVVTQGLKKESSNKEPHIIEINLHWWVDAPERRRDTQTPQRRLHFAPQPPATTLLQLKVIGNLTKTRYTVHCVQAVDHDQPLRLDHPEARLLCGLLRDWLMEITEKSVAVIETHLLDLGTVHHMAGIGRDPFDTQRVHNGQNIGDFKHKEQEPAGSGPGESE